MPIVELVAFDGCPNRDRARANLRAALAEAGLPSVWQELDASGRNVPDHARGWGSPTILVDGVDAAGRPHHRAASRPVACTAPWEITERLPWP